MIKFQTQFETAGDGYWSDVAKTVTTTGIAVPYVNDEEDFGELRVYFTKDWDVRKDGLIYTDSLFLVMLREKLAECGFDATDVEYSEQGMQGDNYVSLDVEEKFLKSWFNVVDKALN
jgi:hypothetical protein